MLGFQIPVQQIMFVLTYLILHHIILFKPIIIKLPNGNFVTAAYSGTVFFNNKFVLKNVLYVPNFSFNLISISRLTTSLKCGLIFSSTECLIHNFITKDKIGTVDVVVGLYVFNKVGLYVYHSFSQKKIGQSCYSWIFFSILNLIQNVSSF